MKTKLFIALILFISACSSYDDYIQANGQPTTITDDLNYKIDDWLDNPTHIIYDVSPIAIYYGETDNPDWEYSNYRYLQAEQFNKMFWDTVYNIISDPMKYYNLYSNSYEYRNNINWGFVNGTFKLLQYIVLIHNIPSLEIGTNDNIVQNGMKIKKIKKTTIYSEIEIYGKRIKLTEGNKTFGLKHIRQRHYPQYYIDNNLKCSKHTNLFLYSDDKSTIELFNDLNNAKLIKIKSLNSNYTAFKARLDCPADITRCYNIVYNQYNEVVTFYPSSRISREYLGNCFPIYTKVKFKK